MKLSRLQSLRRSRPAWWLAVLAAVLQLAMGLQSAQHQVRMAGQSDLLAVCTPTGIAWVAAESQGDGPDSVPAAQSQCVVCAAAAFMPLLPDIVAGPPAPVLAELTPQPLPHWWPSSGPPVGLPLARAPPQLS